MFYTHDQIATEYMAYAADGGEMPFHEYVTFNPPVIEQQAAA